jgi:NAD+ synthase (glutamine-hydrolysing)
MRRRYDAGMRICLAQMDVQAGCPEANAARMLGFVARAREARGDLIVFPELALSGYFVGDEWDRSAFLRACEAAGEEVRAASRGLAVVFGNVGVDRSRRNEDGRVRKYNAFFLAVDGAFVPGCGGRYPFGIKTLSPNYRVFDENRHFHDARKLALEEGVPLAAVLTPFRVGAWTLGGMVCEDVWDADYAHSPADLLTAGGARLLVSINASPYTFNKQHKRHRVLSALAARLQRPVAYVNQSGVQNNGKNVFTFDGGAGVYDAAGNWAGSRTRFGEDLSVAEVGDDGRVAGGAPPALVEDDPAVLAAALEYGTRRFLADRGVQRVVVGVSGGIDSATVAALHARLLPPEDLLLLNLPARFNSPTTIGLARDLASRLGCLYGEVPIDEAVDLTRRQLETLVALDPMGREVRLALGGGVMENVQARDRGARVLAGVAAAFRGAFTCNANKTEIATGYGTMYGDIAGYLAPLGDLWKGQVYAVAREFSRAAAGRDAIPEGIFAVTPSAELSREQAVDEGKGDPFVYPYHDALLRAWVERWDRPTPEETLQWYLDGAIEKEIGYEGRVGEIFRTPAAFVADVERCWSLYQGLAVAKRIQAPPVLVVSRRAFGFDHREAQLGVRYTARYAALKAKCLAPKD